MNFERHKVAKKGESVSSKRLMMAFDANLKMTVGEVTVNGKEHLSEIPPGKKVIIVTTHISDVDMPVATSVLGRELDVAITNMPKQHSFMKDPAINTAVRIAGKENFIPIDFSPDNFGKMKKALESGKAVIIAGHAPSKEWKLERGGYGAAYLANIVKDAVILPVSMNAKAEDGGKREENTLTNMKKKPDVDVFIGNPFEIAPVEGMEEMAEIAERAKNGQSPTTEELTQFSVLKKKLREQSDYIMRVLAEPLPESKQGAYAKREAASTAEA